MQVSSCQGTHHAVDEDLEGLLAHRHKLLGHLVLLHHILLRYRRDDDPCAHK